MFSKSHLIKALKYKDSGYQLSKNQDELFVECTLTWYYIPSKQIGFAKGVYYHGDIQASDNCKVEEVFLTKSFVATALANIAKFDNLTKRNDCSDMQDERLIAQDAGYIDINFDETISNNNPK